MLSGLKLCVSPASGEGEAAGLPLFPEVSKEIPQELYCRRYAPLWHLTMSRPLTYAQYKTATDTSGAPNPNLQPPNPQPPTPNAPEYDSPQLLQSAVASFKEVRGRGVAVWFMLQCGFWGFGFGCWVFGFGVFAMLFGVHGS